jgi:hypothetical protein
MTLKFGICKASYEEEDWTVGVLVLVPIFFPVLVPVVFVRLDVVYVVVLDVAGIGHNAAFAPRYTTKLARST